MGRTGYPTHRSGLVLFTLAAVLAAMLAAPATLGAQRTDRCGGITRWPVKVLIDDDTARVDHTPRLTTVGALLMLPRPEETRPRRARLPLERWTFRVRAVLLETRPSQDDGDLHLILGDPVDTRLMMVAEIPDSVCALDSRFASDYAEARRVVHRIPIGEEIDVTGVAFWDSDHGQRGMAENGIELHPVLRVEPVLKADGLGLLAREGPAALLEPGDTTGVRVWVNTSSRVYHCPGSQLYGRTARGEYMPESAARRRGARPAGGRPCDRR
ncbi:MAG: hypothetical protein KJZ74_02175 [Gemmatimonadales bacterium]|nr:hypothetical protein [Gemmatimonadales bacterium]